MAAKIAPYDRDGDGKVDMDEVLEYFANKKEFNQYDTNGDAVLDAEELLARAEASGSGRTREQIEQRISDYDVDESGTLDLNESSAVMTDLADLKAMKEHFDKYDSNEDGLLSVDELVARAEDTGSGRTREQIEDRVRDFDDDMDSQLSFDEAVNVEEHKKEMQKRKAEFTKYDVNGDKLLSVDELVARADEIGSGRTVEEIQQRVTDYDSDGDGMINVSEAKSIADDIAFGKRVAKDFNTTD